MSISLYNDEIENKNKNKKECIFSVQTMNKYFFLPFLVPILCFFTKFFSEPIKDDDGKKTLEEIDNDVEHTFVFLYQIINSTSLIFGGLLYIVSVLKSKGEKSDDNKYTTVQSLNNSIYSKVMKSYEEKVEDYKKNKFKTTAIILFMSIIVTIYNIIKGYATKHHQLEKRLYFLFFFTLINICIFKKPIYSHQILSLIIGLIGMGIIFTTFFITLNYDTYNYFYDIILFFGSIFYSLYLVLVKYLSTNLGMSPFLLLLLIGFISTLLTIIGYSVFSLINKGDLSYLLNIFHCDEKNYVCFGKYWLKIVIYTIINTLLQVMIFLVVYYFSPEIFAISDIISPFFSFIYGFIRIYMKINEIDTFYVVSNISGYLIIIIASFIYNEILVCNFCGLNENTWKAIDKKANYEMSGKFGRDSNEIGDGLKLERFESSSSNNTIRQ